MSKISDIKANEIPCVIQTHEINTKKLYVKI